MEQAQRRSRVWLWRQATVAIGHAIVDAVRYGPLAAVRTAAVGAGLLAIGAQLSLWVYLQATYHFPFHGAWVNSRWFVLGWHSAYLPLNTLWCATALAVGMALRRVD